MIRGLSPVYAFRKNASMIDFPGKLAAVFFVSGCNFRCGFCHNAELVEQRSERLSWQRLRQVCARFRNDWVDAAVVTGGEPTLAPELPGLFDLLREYGFALKLDTNGSNPQRLSSLLPGLEYVAMDVKCAPDTYARLTGFDRADLIRESISLIRSHARDYEFRTTVITPVHTDEEMRGVGEMIRGARRFVLQPFVPQKNLPDAALRTIARTTPARMRALKIVMAPFADQVICRE